MGRVLDREAAHRLRQMYEERDAKGNRRWTIIQIADIAGVSETTAWRAIKGVGQYRGLPQAKDEAAIAREAAESFARLQAANPELFKPLEPLVSASAKMAALIKEEQLRNTTGDRMIDELTGDVIAAFGK